MAARVASQLVLVMQCNFLRNKGDGIWLTLYNLNLGTLNPEPLNLPAGTFR